MESNNYWEKFFDLNNIIYPILFSILFSALYLIIGYFLKLTFNDIWFAFSAIIGFIVGNIIKTKKND